MVYAPHWIATDLNSTLVELAPPWLPSTTEDDKLSQILEHIKKLDRKVNVQDGVIAQLKDDNNALKDNNKTLKYDNTSSESVSGDSRRR